MLFNEIYSAYFNAVAAILTEALRGGITDSRIAGIARERAFSESFVEVLPALKNEDWLLLNGEKRTPLKKPPRMPLTTLQKRWLAALLTDPRIALFEPDTSGLEGVEPLFTAADVVCFDRYADGDPYDDPRYIATFRLVMRALTERRKLRVSLRSRHGELSVRTHIPYCLEYSGKDDKFRLLTSGGRYSYTVNLARIVEVELLGQYDADEVVPPAPREDCLHFELTDARNALERVLLHFSDCRKETQRIDRTHYAVTLWYHREDETEMVIRLLAFGPMIRVTEPAQMVEKLKARITKQRALFFEVANSVE